jgi:rRNA processing protein Gar1
MFAVGKCWKKKGWIISVYGRVDELYYTLKARKEKADVNSYVLYDRKKRHGKG